MLEPLKLGFSDGIFENPANDKYSRVGSEKAKLFLFNDFRCSKDLMPWNYMMLLLEGEAKKINYPKEHLH